MGSSRKQPYTRHNMHNRYPRIRHPFSEAVVGRTPSEVGAGAGIVGGVHGDGRNAPAGEG